MQINTASVHGSYISAARNTAASSKPTAIATGMSRPDLGGGAVRARALLGGGAPPRRRLVGGRRGMPDGSVPIVIRLGSRRDHFGLARHAAGAGR